jgi:4-hydroxybenzoate polyprenyltransferase
VGASHAALAATVVLAARGTVAEWRPVVWACSALILVVMGDAALCDIGDAEADRAHGTRTIPVVMGAGATWAAAWIAAGLACGVIALGVQRGALRAEAAWAAALSLLITQGMLAAAGRRWPRALRDLVDFRLGIVAIAALISRA